MSELTDSAAAQTSATDDLLGYRVYAEALWERAVKALDKDNASGKPLGDDPLVVGLFGEWGGQIAFAEADVRAGAGAVGARHC